MKRAHQQKFAHEEPHKYLRLTSNVTSEELDFLKNIFSDNYCKMILKILRFPQSNRDNNHRFKYFVFDKKNVIIMKYEKKHNFYQDYLSFPYVKYFNFDFHPSQENELTFNNSEEDEINIVIDNEENEDFKSKSCSFIDEYETLI